MLVIHRSNFFCNIPILRPNNNMASSYVCNFSKKIIVLKKVIFPGVIFLVGGIVMDLILEIVKVRMSIKSLFVRLVVEVCIGVIIYCMTTLSGMILIKKIKDNK